MNKLPLITTKITERTRLYKFHIPGEVAALRGLNHADRDDYLRYKKMFNDPGVIEYMDSVGGNVTRKEFRELLDYAILLAVYRAEDVKKRLQGWVQFVPEELHRLSRIPELKKIAEDPDYLILEVSFARYQSPHQKVKVKGLISSGVRQACRQIEFLEQMEAQKEGRKARKLVVTAYVDTFNKPSIRVLERAGFVKKGSVGYHNPKFKKYYDEDESYYYRLNGSKLDKCIQEAIETSK